MKDKIYQISKTIGLLNSMILSGEQHSKLSTSDVKKALQNLGELESLKSVDAKKYIESEGLEYSLAEYDEGGFLGIDTKLLEESLNKYHNSKLPTEKEFNVPEYWDGNIRESNE